MSSTVSGSEARVPGQRRAKVLGYIKAANELRQSYQSQLSSKWQDSDYDGGIPGAFPDADIVRSGDEELLLFPSYARRHVSSRQSSGTQPRSIAGARADALQSGDGDADYWRQEWQRYEDANAVVDVDVRGWMYSPQKGPLSRRNRLILAVARRLSGIPAPDPSPIPSRESSTVRDRIRDGFMSQEEEMAAREAELLDRRGRMEAAAASTGKYKEDEALIDFSPSGSRSSSPTRPPLSRTVTSESQEKQSLRKRASWNNSQQMSREEIATANELLMTRLRPFMTTPLANSPITIFFYNDHSSQSKSVYTDESGHFKMRAALNFVPTKVRVLASETLSVTENVLVTDQRGISLVSDIDDTIKHSAIASGAKEIFKNTFIRELDELTVPGVREWYNLMAGMGVKMHYVSNSPWQLYPLLKSYFALAGLPAGSFHLKLYSGVLQGIFEPAGERKKGSLDRIMQDFPDRQFILVGDSGEADLEVYTDVVQENPGRVLAVYIRDVTSGERLDPSPSGNETRPSLHTRSSSTGETRRMSADVPTMPPRPRSLVEDKLIDVSDSPNGVETPSLSLSNDLDALRFSNKGPPSKPAKPVNLRSSPTNSNGSLHRTDVKRVPPQPPAPRRANTSVPSSSTNSQAAEEGQLYARPPGPAPAQPPRPGMVPRKTTLRKGDPQPQDDGYLAAARQQLTSAYNALPSMRSQSPVRENAPPMPPRRGLSSYPAAAAKWVTGATGGDPAAGGDGGAPGAPYDKKLELWKRRWARSEDIMQRNGVVLRSWRKGDDVMNECARIIERAQNLLDARRS